MRREFLSLSNVCHLSLGSEKAIQVSQRPRPRPPPLVIFNSVNPPARVMNPGKSWTQNLYFPRMSLSLDIF
jgi:hypothetical protein